LIDHIARVQEPIVYRAKSENKPSTIVAHVSDILPNLFKIGDKQFQTAVGELDAIAVVNMWRSAKKPVPEPLIGYVCAKSIVSGRG
jgi:hypothetical protein